MKGRGWIATLLIAPAVIVAIVAGAFLVRGIGTYTSPHTVEGVVIDLVAGRSTDGDTTYAPVVEYEVDGFTYTWQSSVSYGGALVPDIGDRRTLVYDPANPADAMGRSLILLIILPAVFLAGAVIFMAGVVLFSMRSRRRSRQADGAGWQPPDVSPSVRFPADAQRVEADFMGVEPSPLAADGTVRYRVKARAEIDGRLHRFTSGWLDADPTLRLMEVGNKVSVIIDRTDPSRYEIELPGL